MYITEPMSDADLLAKMSVFKQFVIENQIELGLTLENIDAFITSFSEFQEASEDLELSKTILSSNAKIRTTKRDASRILIAQFAQTWRANPQIPDSTLVLLGVPKHRTRVSPLSPKMPTNPSISGDSNGLLTFKWDRNRNNFGTIFSVETAFDMAGPWQVFDVTTKTKIKIKTNPGVPMFFRVCAKKNNETTPYTLPISMWLGDNFIHEPKAA